MRTYKFKNVDPDIISRSVELWNSGLTTDEVAKIIGRSRALISLYLKSRDVDTTRRYSTYSLDESYFESVDSPDKAYWLGFLAADGTVGKRTVSVELQERDRPHLESLKSAVSFTGPVRNTSHVDKRNGKVYRACQLSFSSARLVRSLSGRGWHEFKKTGSTSILQRVPIELKSHLLRGLFDGDGCLTWSGKDAFFTFVDMHKSVTMWYRNELVRELGLSRVKVNSTKAGTSYVFHYGGNIQVKRICEYLYGGKNVMCLQRKLLRALRIMK